MVSSLLILGAALLAQPGDAVFGSLPPDVPTFHLSVNGVDQGSVLLWVSGDWWRKDSIEGLPVRNIGVQFVPDTPWAQTQQMRLPSGAELSYETSAVRKQRLKDGWKNNGYEFMKMPSGVEAPVRTVDRALAKQAAADAAAVEKLSEPTNLRIGSAAAAAPAPVATAAAPAWRGYIGHGLVIVVALLVGAVIVKVLILGNDDQWDRVG